MTAMAPATAAGSLAAVAGQPRVLGLDLSTTCTGLAGNGWTSVIKTKPRSKNTDPRHFAHARFADIIERLGDYLNHTNIDLAVIEKFAPRPGWDMDRQLAALNWMVRHELWQRDIPYALVATSALKLYAVGKGSRHGKDKAAAEDAGISVKEPVLTAVGEWFPWFSGGNDEADAAVLHCMGMDWLGFPVVAMPGAQRRALDAVEWPPLTLAVAA